MTIKRRKTPTVYIGQIPLGVNFPIVIQSMTDTPTADVDATAGQIKKLADAGSKLVRITINDAQAMSAVPDIIRSLQKDGYQTPIIGDFHFNGHILLSEYPHSAQLLDKYRINPGNIGSGAKRDKNFETIIRIAIENNKPIRIGVNFGSIDKELLAGLMNKNAKLRNPKDPKETIYSAMVESALASAKAAHKWGLPKDKIVLSVKMSSVQDTITVYQRLAKQCDYVLHVGVTEAGSDLQGTVTSASALAILLQQGIGDTIRVSLTPQPNVPRSREVSVCKAILQSLGIRYFIPHVVSCPGCGRTKSDEFQELASDVKLHIQKKIGIWKKKYPGVERLTIAVMGCVVNGPGESRHADIGISLPGTHEKSPAPVYADGEKITTLKGKNIKSQFIKILESYIKNRCGS